MKFKNIPRKKNLFSFRKFNIQPEARERHTICKCKEKIILFGGISDGKKRQSDVWILDLSSGLPNLFIFYF